MRRIAVCLVVAASLAGAVFAYAQVSGWTQALHAADGADAAGKASSAPRVKGHVKNLYPGAQRRLRAKVRNRSNKAVVLRSIRTKVKGAGAGCAKGNLKAHTVHPHQRVRAHDRTKVRIPIKMVAAAPDACQGARFPLRFKARFTHSKTPFSH